MGGAKLPPAKRLLAARLMTRPKRGASAMEPARQVGTSERAAGYAPLRLRGATARSEPARAA